MSHLKGGVSACETADDGLKRGYRFPPPLFSHRSYHSTHGEVRRARSDRSARPTRLRAEEGRRAVLRDTTTSTTQGAFRSEKYPRLRPTRVRPTQFMDEEGSTGNKLPMTPKRVSFGQYPTDRHWRRCVSFCAVFDVVGLVTPECADVRAERLGEAPALHNASAFRRAVSILTHPSAPMHEQHGPTRHMLSPTQARFVACGALRSRFRHRPSAPIYDQDGPARHRLSATHARLVLCSTLRSWFRHTRVRRGTSRTARRGTHMLSTMQVTVVVWVVTGFVTPSSAPRGAKGMASQNTRPPRRTRVSLPELFPVSTRPRKPIHQQQG